MTEFLETILPLFLDDLRDELTHLELNDLNESVLRHLFARRARQCRPKCHIHVEWDRIDLVITDDHTINIIEFKYYVHRFRRQLLSQEVVVKGYPSTKNRAEFNHSVETLRKQRESLRAKFDSHVAVNAYFVLYFADPPELDGEQSFGHFYKDCLANEARWCNVKTLGERHIASNRHATCCLLKIN